MHQWPDLDTSRLKIGRSGHIALGTVRDRQGSFPVGQWTASLKRGGFMLRAWGAEDGSPRQMRRSLSAGRWAWPDPLGWPTLSAAHAGACGGGRGHWHPLALYQRCRQASFRVRHVRVSCFVAVCRSGQSADRTPNAESWNQPACAGLIGAAESSSSRKGQSVRSLSAWPGCSPLPEARRACSLACHRA